MSSKKKTAPRTRTKPAPALPVKHRRRVAVKGLTEMVQKGIDDRAKAVTRVLAMAKRWARYYETLEVVPSPVHWLLKAVHKLEALGG